ncbi:GNAT family N-acetyltransferase [Streptomyces sp. NPDC002138]|uniref:GNAT family N-acetyltransferase n=1 Tax=Streptomyces sp. NPDC002138 TaxID=3154410 RepID=UPI0033314EAC
MSTDVRTIVESELPEWLQAVSTGFLDASVVTEADIVQRTKYTDLSRTQGAFDADTGRCVGTFRSFAQELTVPGGARVAASAVSNVTVSPTHRRRGLLSRMMRADLTAAKERGDVLSTLIAAEYPIYGRYGYGPATAISEWEIDVPRTGLDPRWAAPEGGARIDLVDAAEVRRVGPALHERLRATTHGAVNRTERWWDLATGAEEISVRPYKPTFHAVYRSAAGAVEGLVAYRADDHWADAKVPMNTVTVKDLIGVTVAAQRALWHYLCSIDWVMKVRTGYRAPDDLAPLLLPDPRAARVLTSADYLWVRLLDVAAALRARTYAVSGSLVLEVTDAAGPAGGRFRLDAEAGAGSARCAATAEPADLRLDVGLLGSLYLGDESAVRLAALGGIEELRPGAVALADALLRTGRRPWCPDVF